MSGADPIRGERRTVTALFADVKGSTALGEALDPEDVVDLVGSCVRDICEVVERFGGSVNDIAGDGVLALFGAPTAHEDDPERAIRAGLEIQRAVRSHGERAAREFGVESFGVRVGVETGLVVVGSVGGGTRVEYGATGDAMNTAARLEARADPGEVLVGPATRRQVQERFRWGPVRALELKGKASVVEAAVALAPRDPEEIELPAAHRPRLVGREAELAMCAEAVGNLLEGHGGSTFLAGDPGTGKTRLLGEMRGAAESAGAAWLEGRCTGIDRSRPFAGFVDLLRRWSRGAAAPARSIVERAGLSAAEAVEAMPPLAALLGEERPELAELSPEALRLRTLEALDLVLGRFAEGAPVVVALEDLHWGDPSTLAVADRIADSAPRRRLLLVGTTRTDEQGPYDDLVTAMVSAPERRLVRLLPLAKGADRILLEELAGPRTLRADVQRGILGSAEGNPLYLVELVRALEEAGTLGGADDAGPPGASGASPPGIDRVIRARLDRLPPALREASTDLAVFAQPFSLDLATVVLEDAAPSSIVDELRRRGVLEGSHDALAFAHPLVRDVAHATLLKRRRRELHRSVAVALEAARASGPDELAYHWEEAGDQARALAHHIEAGRRAESVSALLEALAHADAAFRLAPSSDASEGEITDLLLWRAHLRGRTGAMSEARADAEEASKRSRAAADDPRRQRASMELGFALSGAVDYRSSIRLFEEAMELAETRGDIAGQVEAAAALSLAWTNRLRFDRAADYEQRALDLAEATGEDGSIMAALDAAKQVELQLGDFDAQLHHARRLLGFAERRGDLWLKEIICFELGYRAAALAQWDEARRLLDEGSQIGARIGDLGNVAAFGGLYVWMDGVTGAFDLALERGRRDLADARTRSHAEWEAWVSVNLSHALCQWGDLEGARDLLRTGSEAAQRAGADLHSVRAQARLAWLSVELGDTSEAGELLARATEGFARVHTPQGRSFLSGWDAYACAASVMARFGDGEAALELLTPLVAAYRSGDLKEALAGSLLVMAEAHLSLKAQEPARVAAAEAIEVAEAHGMPGLEWRAASALAATSSESEEAERYRQRAEAIVDGLTVRTRNPIIRTQLHAHASRMLEEATWE